MSLSPQYGCYTTNHITYVHNSVIILLLYRNKKMDSRSKGRSKRRAVAVQVPRSIRRGGGSDGYDDYGVDRVNQSTAGTCIHRGTDTERDVTCVVLC